MTIGNDLSKVYSSRKQIEIFDILEGIRPTHNERIWMVSFLRFVDYTYDQVLQIIDKHAQWSDYSQSTTQYQVATIFKQSYRPGNDNATVNNTCKPRVRKWSLTPTEAYRIKLARSAEAHRKNEEWMKENNILVYDACPELPFNPALLGDDGLSKDVARRWR